MSRHRIVRNYIGVDSEYYDDEVIGRSLDDESPLSPSLNQFIYSSRSSENPRDRINSVDCVQEEEEEEEDEEGEEEADGEALHQMSEVLDMGFDMDICRDALLQYDNDVNRALNHVMTQDQQPTLLNSLHTRLQGDRASTGDRTPTNCGSPLRSNTPKSGSPQVPRRQQLQSPAKDTAKDTSTPTGTPKVRKSKPKDIDVLGILKSRTDEKPLINVAVVGHVDAGKSTMMGHLLCILGSISKKEQHRHKTESSKMGKGSFRFAWVLDETEEERERGVTIDVAQTRFDTPKRTVNLLDAPGHKDFVPNMISGASQADIAVLVVDSTPGEFEAGFEAGGQTREHVLLVRALGVQSLVVAVNKMERVEWAEGRFREIEEALGGFIRGVGFRGSEVVFVPVSGLEGENLAERSETTALRAWYNGRSLVEVIDEIEPPSRSYDKPFRLVLTDVFKHPQMGLSGAGKVESGFVIVGTPLVVMPGGAGTLVKSITVNDKNVDYAVAGEQCIVVLGGIDQTKLYTGNVLCEAHARIRSTCKFKARMLVFNIELPITKGFPVDLHYQTVNEPAVISRLISTHNKSTGEILKSKPRCLTKNQVALVEIKCERPICLELSKDNKSLGRITCRYGGNTIAAGMVVEIT